MDDDRMDDWDDVGRCPACGDPIDYCQGHGEIGDPAGRAILDAHDRDDHRGCHVDGCPDAGTDLRNGQEMPGPGYDAQMRPLR